MPYTEHPLFNTPPLEAKIFRYMNFEKFMAMIVSNSLFFSSLHALASIDPYEGEFSDVNKATDNVTWSELPPEAKENLKDEATFERVKELRKKNRQFVRDQRKITFANCWHLQEHESAAMWKLYSRDRTGIAIVSSVERLINSLKGFADFGVMIGEIKYIDFNLDQTEEGNTLTPYINKRKYFDYERELRALIWTPENGKNRMEAEHNRYSQLTGIPVPVDLEILIDSIVLAPDIEIWELGLLVTLLRKYGINRKLVRLSGLSMKPKP